MFADDLCVFSPSVKGLQKLVNVCKEYAVNNCIIFNNDKTVDMIHQNKKFKVNVETNITSDGRCIKFVNSVKYLGLLITNDLYDDLDKTDTFVNYTVLAILYVLNFIIVQAKLKMFFFVLIACLYILFIYGVNSKSAV